MKLSKVAISTGLVASFMFIGGGIAHADTPKSTHEVAIEVINGNYGNGDTRVTNLKSKGFDVKAIQTEVNNILTDIELIEKLIRYANRYRKDNVEFHQQLTVAEQYYREYRYNKTLEIIRNSLDKVEPGAYERIRNSVKPR